MLRTMFAVLRPTPGQRLQRGALRRHLPAVPLEDLLREADEVPGLGVVEADGLDVGLHALDAEGGMAAGVLATGNSLAVARVDALVGGVRREHHRDQQLERRGVLQLRRRFRVGGLQARKDRVCGVAGCMGSSAGAAGLLARTRAAPRARAARSREAPVRAPRSASRLSAGAGAATSGGASAARGTMRDAVDRAGRHAQLAAGAQRRDDGVHAAAARRRWHRPGRAAGTWRSRCSAPRRSCATSGGLHAVLPGSAASPRRSAAARARRSSRRRPAGTG